MIKLFFKVLLFWLIIVGLTACKVGPNYVRPDVTVPTHYKEAPKGWKIAQPMDHIDRGEWWKLFHDSKLNQLESCLNISNQNIAQAAAQYFQARALVDQARAALFPVIGASASFIGEKAASFTSSSSPSFVKSTPPFNIYSTSFNASWEPDIWGGVRRNVESNRAATQAAAAQLAAVQLSSQALLAQDYFQLRTLDADRQLLNATVAANQKTLTLTQQQYKAGTNSLADVVQAQAQLNTSQAQALDTGILRSQYEHAIAVLIGEAPANFSLAFSPLKQSPPRIPGEIPCRLLERRPDIAKAERTVAQANAQIGVAIAAYFPNLNLTGAVGFQTNNLTKLFSTPALFWSLGSQLTATLFQGGLLNANAAYARGSYYATVAAYRQTVLSAFQNVEDNFTSLRILAAEAKIQQQAVAANKTALKLILAQYKAGTAAYTSVLVAQTNTYTAEKNLIDTGGRRMVAAVGLITALGGGWDTTQIDDAATIRRQQVEAMAKERIPQPAVKD